jgi:hypothetical protein
MQMEAVVNQLAVTVCTPGALAGPGGWQLQAAIKKAVQGVYEMGGWVTRQMAVHASYDKWEAIAQAVALLDDAPEDLLKNTCQGDRKQKQKKPATSKRSV